MELIDSSLSNVEGKQKALQSIEDHPILRILKQKNIIISHICPFKSNVLLDDGKISLRVNKETGEVVGINDCQGFSEHTLCCNITHNLADQELKFSIEELIIEKHKSMPLKCIQISKECVERNGFNL